MKEFGWAFIGCGGIAQRVAKELVKGEGGKIVALYNRTRSRAEEFSAKFGGVVYDTPEEAIKADGVDGVYVATTHDKHAYFTKLSIELGVPVLCEKPFAVNEKEAREVIDLSKEKGVFVAEAMWTWYNKPAHIVREWVKSGRLGEIKSVKAKYAFPLTLMSKNPRLTSPDLIGGALMDIGLYPVRYVYELFGMPLSITAKGKLKGGVDMSENITMEYENFKAEIFVSINRFAGERLTIVGTEGKIDIPNFHVTKKGKLVGKNKDSFKLDILRYDTEFSRVAEDILSGKKESRDCPIKNTLDTMKLLDECRRQMGVIYPNE